MPRPPNPNAKSNRMVIEGKTMEEINKIKAVKEICARNRLEYRKVLLKGINSFLREHNWPPGNSQTILEQFGAELSLVCFRCQKSFRHLKRVEYISGVIGSSCEGCLEKDRQRRVVKRVLGVV